LTAVSQIWRAARRLTIRTGKRRALPPLLFFTDPVRTPDPVAVAERLPRGAAVVFRTFGRDGALEQGRALLRICRRRSLMLIVGADASLAARLGADGVHLPQRLAGRAGDIRALRSRFLVTVAAHDLPAALVARRCGADALVVSPIFRSRSPSAGRPIGPRGLAAMIRCVGAPAYALGGVNVATVRTLAHTGAIGVAAVEALIERRG
jgi:thiamine-phosphate pyrophosphorylase